MINSDWFVQKGFAPSKVKFQAMYVPDKVADAREAKMLTPLG